MAVHQTLLTDTNDGVVAAVTPLAATVGRTPTAMSVPSTCRAAP